MPYFIDAGIWSSVFAVPCSIVDEYIKVCPPTSLRVLLWMLRHGGTVDLEQLSVALHFPIEEISDAVHYWICAGIISGNSGVAQPISSDSIPSSSQNIVPSQAVTSSPVFIDEKENEKTGQKLITVSSRPNLTRADINEMSRIDPNVSVLLEEAQGVLGAPLSPLDSKTIVGFYSYYDMKTEVVLLLLQYCVSIEKTSMSYIEKLAASWAERGINTHERAEAEITRLARDNENEKKLIKIFGIRDRALTAKEKTFVAKWFDFDLDENLLFLACERSVDNTGKVSFSYADKIITSWASNGVKTIAQAMEEIKKTNSTKRQTRQSTSAQTGDSSINVSDLDELIHKQFME